MRQIFTFFATILLTTTLWAQSPEKMSYQAVIRNSSNQLVINQAIGMKISILQGTSNGTVVYQETFNPNQQTNANGLITIEIGSGLPMIGIFESIDWSAGPYFIKTETDPTGGTNYTIIGTSQILSVPYALHAKIAESLIQDITETDPVYSESEASSISAVDISNLSNLSGTNSGDQDLSNYVTSTALTNGLDAKVDKVAGKALSTNDYTTAEQTKLAGIATGAEVNVQADWNATSGDAQIINKPIIPVAQVQTNWTSTTGLGVLLNKPANIDEDKTDDVNLSGNQTINGNKSFIGSVSVKTPVNNTDAVNKAYVDELALRIEALEESVNKYGSMTDWEGNVYKTVKIGNQVWMAENLRTRKDVNGPIDEYVYKYANQDSSTYEEYGLLYNVYSVSGLCPSGWHLPTDTEWKELESTIGMPSTSIDSFGVRGTNEAAELKYYGNSGFNLVYPGYFEFVGFGVDQDFYDFGISARYWCNDIIYPENPSIGCIIYRTIGVNNEKIIRNYNCSDERRNSWGSIRCVKD